MEEVRRLKPDAQEFISELREIYEADERWRDAAELGLREATMVEVGKDQAIIYQALSKLYREKMGDPIGGAMMLDRALHADPENAALYIELLGMHKDARVWMKFMVVGERVIGKLDAEQLDATFYYDMASAYETVNDDVAKAREFYTKAAALDSTLEGIHEKLREMAKAAGDFAAYAAAEEEVLQSVENPDQRVERYVALADIYTKELKEPEKASFALSKARELRPDDAGLLRRAADGYALSDETYGEAVELYDELLKQAPLEPDILRIRARLAGQMQNTEEAYGFYAALLALLPQDDEANGYVNACRSHRPEGLKRGLHS